MFEINGKVAIVTGGAAGIGKATAQAILAKGGIPVIADWDENLGKKTAEELNVPFYSMTKFGLRGLTKSIAIAYGRQGIRANTIHPGHVDTAIGGKGCGEEAYKYDCEHTPVGRTGVPEEIAHAIIFTIKNEFLTGTEIVIDGGWTIQ